MCMFYVNLMKDLFKREALQASASLALWLIRPCTTYCCTQYTTNIEKDEGAISPENLHFFICIQFTACLIISLHLVYVIHYLIFVVPDEDEWNMNTYLFIFYGLDYSMNTNRSSTNVIHIYSLLTQDQLFSEKMRNEDWHHLIVWPRVNRVIDI